MHYHTHAFKKNLSNQFSIFEEKKSFQFAVDGNWSPWKQDSSCSATCGLAFRTSTRECDHPPPQYGGKLCEGNSTDTERCRELPLCAGRSYSS